MKDIYPLEAYSGLTRAFTATAISDGSLGKKNQKTMPPPISNNYLKVAASVNTLFKIYYNLGRSKDA